ncbi:MULTISPECIES: PadR family transcriptional regulator [Rhodopseudomonas]|jgi:DNA-binding PadR family transcriptional regulator|uniref:Transcriptional regulator, PadR-like family n=1 Tax=Rhodopseudomonas palustris (strain DX-1) TaxID=652103 RepID=E6VKP9_RHOPX|nr:MULTISPECIES: PadR family transcriptional regulator [Rhodopseudomonas]
MFGFHKEMQFPGRHGRSGRGHGHHAQAFHAGPRRGGGWEDEIGGVGHPGHGRRGGGRRMFDGSELRLLLLKLIADKPRHGYDLIRAIEERTGGAYAPSPGIVYPTLTMLSEMGLIEEQLTEGARKQFAATAEGAAHLAAHAAELAAIIARLDALGAMRERIDAAPARRAMQNLRSVLQNRLGEGLDKAKLHEAVALIDEVASRIERL